MVVDRRTLPRGRGGRAGFEELRSGLGEGWGSWSAVEDVAYRAHMMVSSGRERLVAVTLVGTRRPEGMVERTAMVVPVSVVEDTVKVLPFPQEPAPVELVQPVSPDEVAALVPADASVMFALDGDVVPPQMSDAEGQRLRASYTPDQPLAAGEHVLTVLVVGEPYGVDAEAFLFEVQSTP